MQQSTFLRSFFRLSLTVVLIGFWLTLCSFNSSAKEINSPPVAGADSYSGIAARRQPAPGLLGNDFDPDSGDGIIINTTPVSNPAHGWVLIFFNGSFIYQPTNGWTGSDSFEYQICDRPDGHPERLCATATVNLINANSAPVAATDVFYGSATGYSSGQNVNLGVLANDSDNEGDVLQVDTNFVSTPQHGWVSFTGFDGRFQYVVTDTGFTGIDSFEYKVCETMIYTSPTPGACSIAKVYVFVGASGDPSPNLGESCPAGNVGEPIPEIVGEPVNVTNGNMWLKQTDYRLPSSIGQAINLTRTYNSQKQTGGYFNYASGLFGYGWTTDYEQYVATFNDNLARVYLGDGRAIFFYRPNTTGDFTPVDGKDFHAVLTKNTNGSFTLKHKDGRVWEFATNGRLVSMKDRNNNQIILNYDGFGRLVGITDSFNRTLNITYNTSGFVGQISDSIGTVADYVYNPNGTLQSVTYADGSKYQFEYTTINSKTYLTTVKDALNNILETHQYDTNGRATTSEKQGGIEKYTLDYTYANDTLAYTSVTDALGRVTKYYFNPGKGRNVITKIEGLCGCGGSGSEVTQYFYDNNLNLTKKVDALGRQMLYTYDSNNNRLSMTDVLGTETYTYNSFGEILTRTDRMNGVTTNTYNATGNLLTSQDALNFTTTLTYDARGQILTIKDALNHTTTLTYDAFGRLTQIKDANNKLTKYAYDARARVTSTTNALNKITSFQYDAANRLNRVTHPDAKFITLTYDLAGRRTQMTDERNNTTNYGYDNAYRLISMTDALNHQNTYGYDLMSNLTSQTDALMNTTNYEYDDFNRLQKVVYPPSVVGAIRLEERIEYDTVGNVKKRIDTANRETLFDYDTANRLIKTTDANLQITEFEYNPRSQMTKVTDALSQVYDFSYDALGRQLSQTRSGNLMSYEYDAVGNRIKRTDYLSQITNYTFDNLNRLTNITYPDATENVGLIYDAVSRLTKATKNAQDVTFAYDTRHRMTSTTDVHGKIVAMTYDAASNRTALKLSGVNFSTYVYDVANRLTKITNSADAKAVNYLYDNANRMTKETLPNGIATTFNYDGMSRLTQLKDAKGAATLFDRQFSYNPANQISQITELTQTRNFAYDNVDRLTAMTNGTANESYTFDGVGNRTASHLSTSYLYQPNNRLTNTTTTSYVYNSNGNMVSKTDVSGTTQYIWDYENRLKQVILPSGQTVIYKYDALGRRSERNLNNGTSWQKFTYDGQDVMLDQNSDGTSITYLNGLGIDNKLRQTVGGQAQYFLTDHLGSTNGLADASGNLIASTSYDSFGNATNANFPSRYQYTGREKDEFTGLHYYRARWYDANLGRFISEDPIGFAGEDMNLYGYVWNNPVMFRDPRGTQGEMVIAPALPMLPALGAIASAAAVAGGAIISSPAVVAGVGFAAGYAIGYYPGHWIARYRFPEQYGDTESCPTTKPDTAPKPIPVPVPVPVSASPAYPRQQPPDDKRRCAKDPISPFGQFSNGQGICTYRCGDGSVLILGNAQWDGRNWICKSR